MAGAIDPGRFRTEMTLEAMVPVGDGAGGFVETWEAVGTVLARIEPRAARDRFGAAQTLEEVTHRVTMRHRIDVRSGMRLRRGGRVLAIVAVHDPDETGRYLVVQAREEGL